MTNKRKSTNRMRDVFDSNLWVFSETAKQRSLFQAARRLEEVMSSKLASEVKVNVSVGGQSKLLTITVTSPNNVFPRFSTEIETPE